ncbi:hypothetical protein [Streptomyces sp. NPDC050738]|uniref:hypothetical protein n=1 Tax=Streptomyces sp. NPDC050738 TaxID=3154744 RepID=UPI00342D4FF9
MQLEEAWLMFGFAKRKQQRATALHAAHQGAQLRTAADIVISRARRNLPQDARGHVSTADVLIAAHEHFGLAAQPADARSALRARYELRSGATDLDTDVYAPVSESTT